MGRGYGRTIARDGTLYNTIKSELDNGFGDPMQLFLRSNRSMGAVKLSDKEITEIRELIDGSNARVYVHSPYVYNFCNSDLNLTELKRELSIATRIGALGLVIHVGKSCKYNDPMESMYRNIVELCKSGTEGGCPVLLETPAGQGTETLTTPEQFGQFYNSVREVTNCIGLCIDTCHVFASGYDPLQYIEELSNVVPELFTQIKLIHLNDSIGECGCKTDRHAPVGGGAIGIAKMSEVIQFIKKYGLDAVTE